jgi:prepilin-type N-terminal cleavage/methylation domain-containing protein
MKRMTGFTLIEVLIAMLLLSLVMFIGSLSFSVFTQRWQSDMGHFTEQADRARKLFLLQRAIQGVSNYFVLDAKKEPVYFFLGNSSHLVFVTNNPLFSSETQALIRLSVISLEEGGKQQLVYQESNFIQSPLFSLTPLPPPERSLVILTAPNIRFNYFGWSSTKDRLEYFSGESFKPVEPVWQDEYLAQNLLILPYAINLTWGENEPIIMPIANDNAFQLIYTNEKRDGV